MSWLTFGLTWLLAPARCAACDVSVRTGRLFCPPCALTILPAQPYALASHVVYPFGLYGGALAESIQRFKYGTRPDLAASLGPLLALAAAPLLEGPGAYVVPIPLAPVKLRERGYNQATLLARHLQRAGRFPVVTSLLRRHRSAATQASLDQHQRAANVVDLFAVTADAYDVRQPVILIDDVMTTGATLSAAAASLRQQGFTVVGAAVLARTPAYRKETLP